MAYKIGFILSLIFVVQLFVLMGDIMAIQMIYTNLDAVSVTAGYLISQNGKITTKTNHSGGIQGGISNGEEIYFRVVFKPTPTIFKQQNTVNIKGENTIIQPSGRHDPCVVPRAIPIVEAMAYLTIMDYYLINKIYKDN